MLYYHKFLEWYLKLTTTELTRDEINKTYVEILILRLFRIHSRKSSISKEIKCGVLHFVSCSFILAVNPILLNYSNNATTNNSIAVGTSLSAGVSCILCGLFANLPFLLTPTTSTSLYYALYLQNQNISSEDGKVSVFILGILYSLCSFRPIAKIIANSIPFVIKVGVCLGTGLLIALEALIEIGLVKNGSEVLLNIGEFSLDIYIAVIAFVGIGLALHFKIRGAFLIGLIFGTSMFWLKELIENKVNYVNFNINDFVIHSNDVQVSLDSKSWAKLYDYKMYRLIFDLYIIGVILLNGLSHGLAETAGLRRVDDDTIPRSKWLYAICGIGTMLSAVLGISIFLNALLVNY